VAFSELVLSLAFGRLEFVICRGERAATHATAIARAPRF
jgi:hypothetical protein